MIFLKTELLLLGDVTVPSFLVESGHLTIIKWPKPKGGKEEHLFYEKLSVIPIQNFSDNEMRAKESNPYNASFLALTLEKLLKQCSCDTDLENVINERKGENVCSEAIANIPLSVRVVLAIAQASVKSKVVVYNTAGLDPLGLHMITQYVRARSKKGWGFIEICFPMLGDIPTKHVSIETKVVV